MPTNSSTASAEETARAEQLGLGRRLSTWIETPEGPLFAQLHPPSAEGRSAMAVLVCPPIGHEYTNTHRTIRYLADALARSGHPTLRLDYAGSGDSDEVENSANLLDLWQANVQAAMSWLSEQTSCEKICVIGLRMGATVAALASESHPVDHLVLWDPYIDGRAHIRDIELVGQYHDVADTASATELAGAIDYAGMLLDPETVTAIKQLRLIKAELGVRESALVVLRNDIASNDRLAKSIENQGIAVHQVEGPGFPDMMKRAQDAVVPLETLATISKWVDAAAGEARSPWDEIKSCDQVDLSRAKCREHACRFGDTRACFGILCTPLEDSARERPIVVLQNIGSAHHVGPNRLQVQLCRALARAGFASFRYDLANLGDSSPGGEAHENHPYPPHAAHDLEAACQFLGREHGYHRFVPAGLCSGSHTAFHAGLELKRLGLVESVVINPLLFYWRGDDGSQGKALSHELFELGTAQKQFAHSMADASKWRRLVRGDVDYRALSRFAGRVLRTRVRSVAARIERRIRGRQQTQLGRDLDRYAKGGVHLTFFISSTDPGLELLEGAAGRELETGKNRGCIDLHLIPGADHTFTTHGCRRDFVDRFVAHFERRYPGD